MLLAIIISFPANLLLSVPVASPAFETSPRFPPRFRTVNTKHAQSFYHHTHRPKPSPKLPQTLSALQFSSPTLSNRLSPPPYLSQSVVTASRRSVSSPVSRQFRDFLSGPSNDFPAESSSSPFRAFPRVLVYEVFATHHCPRSTMTTRCKIVVLAFVVRLLEYPHTKSALFIHNGGCFFVSLLHAENFFWKRDESTYDADAKIHRAAFLRSFPPDRANAISSARWRREISRRPIVSVPRGWRRAFRGTRS